jgi:enoyl-CoA hydratase
MAMVEYETRGRIGIFTLNRPEARNAVNGEVAADMEAAVDRFEDDPDVWVGVITATLVGDRPVFSAGADLKAVNTAAGRHRHRRAASPGFAAAHEARDRRRRPRDSRRVRICSRAISSSHPAIVVRSRSQAQPRRRRGRAVPPARASEGAAMEVILTGEPLSAQRAHELGLVNRLCEPEASLDTAIALAEQICLSAPMAVRESRKIVLASDYEDDETLKKMTNKAMANVMGSEDLKEGLAAFVETRRAGR